MKLKQIAGVFQSYVSIFNVISVISLKEVCLLVILKQLIRASLDYVSIFNVIRAMAVKDVYFSFPNIYLLNFEVNKKYFESISAVIRIIALKKFVLFFRHLF